MSRRGRPGGEDRGWPATTASAVASGRYRSAPAQGRTVFFEAQSFAAQEQPDRIVRDLDAAPSQFALERVQRQMRRLAQSLNDERAMGRQHWLAVSAHLARRNRTRRTIPLRPLHYRRYRHAEPRCHRPRARPISKRCNHTLSKILGKRSRHQMLASPPASILNHKPPPRGIPPDSAKA